VPRIDAVWVRAAAAELGRRGVPAASVFAAAGLRPDLVAAPRARIPYRAYAAFLEAAAEVGRDPLFGFKLGGAVDTREAGLIAYVCLNARDIGAALRNLERYITVFNEAMRVRLTAEPDQLALEMRLVDRGQHRQAIEFGLALAAQAIRKLSGGAAPIDVIVAHSRRGGAGEFRRMLGCPVEFGRGRTVMRFDPQLAARQVPTADDRLLAVLVEHCQSILAARRPTTADLRRQVEQEILARLQGGGAKIEQIAEALGMSPRTLVRRLAAEGTGFGAILRELQKDLAIGYLGDSALGLAEIAFLVGYADASAFSHAFRRWTGRQPGAFRGVAPRLRVVPSGTRSVA
jgi:AraC-like DNA-binding protein